MKKNSISLFNDLFDDNFSIFQLKNDFYNLRTNIKELENEYIFEINVAGVDKENINISIEEEYLIVSITEKEQQENNNDIYLRKEMSYKNTKRKYYVGNIKEENIKAALNNGILTITVPKENNEPKKKNIEIK